TLRKLETSTHHADDRIGLFVNSDRAANDAGLGSETAPPQAVANQREITVLMLVVITLKRPAQLWLGAQNVHEIGSDCGPIDSIGFTVTSEVEVAVESRTQLSESLVLLAPVDKIAGRHRSAFGSRRSLPEHDQTLRVRIGQWSQDDCVDDTEDCCVRANSQRQSDQRNGGKSRTLQ